MRVEIDDVIGFWLVSFVDWDKMFFIDVVFIEMLRVGNIVFFVFFYIVFYDVNWNGYFILKGVIIWLCLDFVMNDDDMFIDLEYFNLEWFLDLEGKWFGNEKFVIFFLLGKIL